MMFVQKAEIFGPVLVHRNSESEASVSPINCIVSTYNRIYTVVIYINYFKRDRLQALIIALQSLVSIGIMTNFEMSDIRMFCPYLL